jgi:uncharacterized protein YbjT (DUF2867 family)
MILLTGATGRIGSAAVTALLSAGVSFRAVVCDSDKVAVDALCVFFAKIAAGSLEEQNSNTADLLGRPAVVLKTVAQQFAGTFAPAN